MLLLCRNRCDIGLIGCVCSDIQGWNNGIVSGVKTQYSIWTALILFYLTLLELTPQVPINQDTHSFFQVLIFCLLLNGRTKIYMNSLHWWSYLPESVWTWWAWPSCWHLQCGSCEGPPPWTLGRACRPSERWQRAWRTPASLHAC